MIKEQEKAEEIFWSFDANHDKATTCVEQILEALDFNFWQNKELIAYYDKVLSLIEKL